MLRCYICEKEIKKREDANILAYLGFIPRVFCNNCYSSKERGILRHLLFFPKQPINSTIYIVGLWVLTILSIIIPLFFILSRAFSIGVLFSVFFLVILLVWQWTLYFSARKKLSMIELKTSFR